MPVDSHLAAITPATRWIAAAKLSSVLSLRIATARNSLIFGRKFSILWRQRYISLSCARDFLRFRFAGITATAPRACSSSGSQSASNSRSATGASNGSPSSSGGGPAMPGRRGQPFARRRATGGRRIPQARKERQRSGWRMHWMCEGFHAVFMAGGVFGARRSGPARAESG